MTDLAKNSKAFFNYEILETFEAGLVLQGTEIKSLRDNGGRIDQAYIVITKGEAWVKAMHIAPYAYGNLHNHEPTRDRKLLLHKREITLLHKSLTQKGQTAVPLVLYLSKGKAKLKIALARGKKTHEKKETLKERDIARQMRRDIKEA